MNKTAIKNFAIWARNKLRADIILKAGLLGITDKGIVEPSKQSTGDLQIFDIGTSQPIQLKGKTAIEQRKSLVSAIRAKNLKHPEAFDAVIEEVAYTWFNRLIAVRFMEVNDYLPSRVRVLSSENPAKAEPDFVTNPFDTDLEFTPAELDLIDDLKDHNKSDELFQFLFIKQCNKLNEILPELFEKTNDYTELLLNVSFTDKDGVVYHLVHDISEDDFNIEKQGQVEIIGWLYQYYNTEPKDKVFGRPSGQKIRKEDVPAATQLFTPDWIVRYMVENSLGRIVIHNLKYGDWNDTERAKIDTFKAKWKYYLEEAEQSQEIIDRFRTEESNKYNGDEPPYVNSTFLDPCMGSGHILVYAFDVFMDIYTAQGYTERDAAQRIVEKNLYGLELDDRATQLAYFAVMMKARSYDRRFLIRGIRPNLCSIQESNSLNEEDLELFGDLKPTAQKLIDEFIDAKEYGSILNLSITTDEIAQLESKYAEIDETIYDNLLDRTCQIGIRTLFAPLIKQAKIMIEKYDVVCTNPPYMGSSGMNNKLSAFVKKHYPDSKADLFSVFIEKAYQWVVYEGYTSLITMESWMFLSSFEKLRERIIKEKTIVNMVHMPYLGKGGTSLGINFGTAAVITKNSYFENYNAQYEYTVYYETDEKGVPFVFPTINERWSTAKQTDFSKISGSPIAYWWSNNIFHCFDEKKIDFGTPMKGIQTGKGEKFIRFWYEVSILKTGFKLQSYEEITKYKMKWIPLTSGGIRRRWYGNFENVVNLENNGLDIRSLPNNNFRLKNPDYYFCEGLTWTEVTSSYFTCRYLPSNILFGNGGPVSFFNKDLYYLLGLLNSCVVKEFFSVLAPTMNVGPDQVRNIPYKYFRSNEVNNFVEQNISLSKTDWDSFETSWDFTRHPFLNYLAKSEEERTVACQYGTVVQCPIEYSYCMWMIDCDERFNQLKSNEEELNRIFIDIYGLQDELTPDVEDKDVTVRKADLQRDMRSFVSYAVSCMFGRYSIYKEGLLFAGEKYSLEAFVEKLNQREITVSEEEINRAYNNEGVIVNEMFFPDDDNCIPITDTAYFEDDIVGRFCEFVKVVFGEDTLEANLEFVAKALGNKGNTSRDIIRNYFLNDFFKDHCKIYQKRPIYWLFDSGKQNGFKALVYMHRWNADTIGNMRVEYLHRIQRTYEKEIEREQDTIDNTTNNRDRAAATKRKEKLVKQLKEAKDYDAKVAHLALSRPDIDLDDGVKVNYEKVQTAPDGKKLQILAKI